MLVNVVLHEGNWELILEILRKYESDLEIGNRLKEIILQIERQLYVKYKCKLCNRILRYEIEASEHFKEYHDLEDYSELIEEIDYR